MPSRRCSGCQLGVQLERLPVVLRNVVPWSNRSISLEEHKLGADGWLHRHSGWKRCLAQGFDEGERETRVEGEREATVEGKREATVEGGREARWKERGPEEQESSGGWRNG